MLSDKGQDYFLGKKLTSTRSFPARKAPRNVPALKDLGAPDVALTDLSSLDKTVELLTKVGLI